MKKSFSAEACGTDESPGLEPLSRKADLEGVGFSPESHDELYAAVCQWLRGRRGTTCVLGYVNPHVFNLARSNDQVRRFLQSADVVTVDGLGFALAVRWLMGHRQTRTVTSCLFDRVLATEDLPKLRAVLIGGSRLIAERGAAAMNRVARRIEITAVCPGYQPVEDHLAFLREHLNADAVFVAMGTPYSEELILAARELFPGKLFWSIGGGTLHYYAGTLRRVPQWVSSAGLQWLWRILYEPGIAPRYLVGIPRFLAHLLESRKQRAPNVMQVYGRAHR